MAQQRTLEAQAVSIEHALARQHVKGMVMRGVVTPQHIRYEVALERNATAAVAGNDSSSSALTRLTSDTLAGEIALALGEHDVRIRQHGDVLQVETARERIEAVRLLPLCNRLHHVPAATAILGVDESGAPLLLRFSAPEVAHVLIAGITDAGKTALARTMITSLIMHNRQSQAQIILIDPKRRGFAPLEQMPHVLGNLVSTPQETADCLKWLIREMERREQTNEREPALIVAVDEVPDLIQTVGAKLSAMLARLAQRGRESGIHLIICAQKPTAEYIGSDLKAALPVRLVGAVASAEEARYATGINDSGAEELEGRGDFLLIVHGEAIRFQAAWVGRNDLKMVAARLAEGGTIPLRFPEVVRTVAPVATSAATMQPATSQRAVLASERKHRGLAGSMHYLWQRLAGA